jgi:phosphatidate cytidylyltransferase
LDFKKQTCLMQLVLASILFYILIAAAGMAIANKKVPATVARQRWLKFATYIIITALVISSIFFGWFFMLALLIVAASYYELAVTIRLNKKPAFIALFIFTILACGFLLFAYHLPLQLHFFIYFQVLTFDAFCQITGQLLGKKTIANRVSSAKTWEGLAGGILFCLLASFITSNWLNFSLHWAIVLGLFTSLTAFAGDMLASYYKRIAGIKDYSNLLPAHGGFLDRFDSSIMSGFCYFVFYTVMPPFPFANFG